MKITVIGCGYLGAVHAACMAKLGHDVLGVDVDPTRVDMLNNATPPFYEPGFPELLEESIASGRLRFATELEPADVHFIAVGTPQSADGTAADMSYVNSAVDSIIAVQPAGSVVVGKSTVPVGTAQGLHARLAEHGATLVWNPEFLREGTAVQDTIAPDRIVYGVPAGDDRGRQALDQVYAQLLEANIPQVITDFATAELVKVAANSFLATKISFINAMSELCEATGGDVTQLAEAIGYDERIGNKFLKAGIGFGGGCLPKDIRAFSARAEELGVGNAVSFLTEIDAINMRRRERVVGQVQQRIRPGHKVAVLGAAFKANSDDIRDSPALFIANQLDQAGVEVVVYDPQAMPNIHRFYPHLTTASSAEDALRDAEMTLVLTEWKQFKELDPAATAQLVAGKTMLDGRNILDPAEWKGAGWDYIGMGR